MLSVQMAAIAAYLAKITARRESPLVKRLINVPLATSLGSDPLKTSMVTIKPICWIFLKNWLQESREEGSGMVMLIPSGISFGISSGVSLATRGS